MFSTSSKLEWGDLVARGLEVQANRHFLDVIARNRNKVLLSIPKADVKPGTYLFEEIVYLTKEKGFTWVNQWKLVPPLK